MEIDVESQIRRTLAASSLLHQRRGGGYAAVNGRCAAAAAAVCVHHSWSGRHYQIMRSKLPLSYVRMYEKRM